MEQEEWRPIVNYDGHYEVSNLGRIRQVRTGHILKTSISCSGCSVVTIHDSQRQSTQTVSRLVATTFLGPACTPSMQVYHKDGNRRNNSVDNLYWAQRGILLHSEEVNRKRAATQRTAEYRSKVSAKMKAICTTPEGRMHIQAMNYASAEKGRKPLICLETGVIYPSVLAAAKAVDRDPSAVARSCREANNGTLRRLRGSGSKPAFHFRYYDPEEWKPKERIWRPLPIPEIADKYEISNMGEVRTVVTGYYRKTIWSDASRNVHVSFMVKGKVRTFTLGSLVANAFLPKQYGADCVIHRDGNPKNNCVTNLVRVPKRGVYTYPMSRTSEGGGRAERPVECIETGELYLSITEAARKRQVSYQTVLCSCRRSAVNMKPRCKKRIGKPVYHFRYADE